jgi:hypothetical protein
VARELVLWSRKGVEYHFGSISSKGCKRGSSGRYGHVIRSKPSILIEVLGVKKIGVLALLVLVTACGSEVFERDAIRATVVLDPAVNATCVLLEVRDPADKRVLGKSWLSRSDNELRAAIFKGSLPGTVELAARPYLDGSCANGAEAQTPNGAFVTGTASFATGKVVEAAPLSLQPGTDGDGDGYVGTGAGGADCNDGAPAVKPGAVETCSEQSDLNCDNKKGCEAASCGPQACFGPPAAIALTVPTPLTAGMCVSGGMVQLKDAASVNSRASVDTQVNLQVPGSNVGFYSDAACTVSVTSVTVAVNTGSASFFVQGQLVGPATVTASANGLAAGTQAVTVNPGAGNRLAFLSPARTAMAGACSLAVQVQSRDAQNNPSPVTTATTIGLNANPNTGFKFYSDAGCTTEVGSVSLGMGASEASFFFKGTKAGAVTVSVTATGFTGATQGETINPGPPAFIVIAGPVTVQAATCSPAISATLQDAFNNPTTAGANTQINLSAGGAPLSIFSNNTCGTAASSVTIAQGTGARDFFVRGTQAGTYTVTASNGPLTSGTVSVTVTPGPATVLAFTTGQQSLQAGACSGAATVELRDANANPVTVATATTVNLSVAPSQGFQFFTDSNCSVAAGTTASIAANSSTATFFFKSTKAVTGAALSAAVNSITANQPVTITAAPPTMLAFTVLPGTAAAGACTAVTAQTQDSFNNPSTVSSAQAVSLAASPTDGFTFHTANNCSGGSTTTQVSVPSGQDSITFYARGTKAAPVSLSGTSAGLSNAAGSITITALAASKVAFATQPRSATAGSCSPVVTLESTDTFGNVVTVGSAENVALSVPAGDPAFKFYSDSNCTTIITNVSIAASQSSASFFFKGDKARTVTVTANAASLTDATQDQTITGANATTLVFSAATPPNPMLAGTCALRTVESVDTFGNPATDALTLTLSANALAEFFSDSNCTAAITTVALPAGAGAASFYFKGFAGGINAAASLTLTAEATPALSATQTEFINPTVRTGSCTIAGTADNVNCTISLALGSVNRAFMVFQATNAAGDAGGANARCYVNSTSQVKCERGDNNGGAMTIAWSVAEFPAGVNVQRQQIDCSADTTNANLSAVNLNSTFLLFSSRRDDAGQGTSVPRLVELKSSTLAEIRKTGGCHATDANSIQAVDYTGAAVQRGLTTTMVSGDTSEDVTLSPSVDPARSIVLFSYLNDGSGNPICNRSLRGELINSGATLRFSRAEGNAANNCANSNFSAISWEVVQFPAGTVVQQVAVPMAAASSSAVVTLPAQVDPSRTLVLMGSQMSSGQAGGEGRYSSGEIAGEMRARAALNPAGTTLTLLRDSANASANFTVYVVQLKP